MNDNKTTKEAMNIKQQHQAIDDIETYMDSAQVSLHKIWAFICLSFKELRAR